MEEGRGMDETREGLKFQTFSYITTDTHAVMNQQFQISNNC